MHEFGRRLVLVVGWLGSAGLAPLAAQSEEQKDTVVTPAEVENAEPTPNVGGIINLSGYVTTSYTYSNHAVGNQIVGRFFDRYQDQFMANAFKLVVEKPVATDKLDAGARADLLFGQNAQVTQATGLSLGPNGDLWQVFATLNVPLSKEKGTYLQFKAGKLATMMGIELLETVVNPNLSVANQFVYLENFTYTGLLGYAKLSSVFDLTLMVNNGWDVVLDNNTKKSFMGRLGITPAPATVIGIIGYTGDEQAAVDGVTPSNPRSGFEGTLSQKIGAKTTVYLQGDYGSEKGLLANPDEAAKWWGIGGWVAADFSSKLGLGVRADYIDDENGVRSGGVLGYPSDIYGGSNKFGSVTGTLNVRVWKGALLQPELRYDYSTAKSADGADVKPFDGESSQFSVGLGLSYIF